MSLYYLRSRRQGKSSQAFQKKGFENIKMQEAEKSKHFYICDRWKEGP